VPAKGRHCFLSPVARWLPLSPYLSRWCRWLYLSQGDPEGITSLQVLSVLVLGAYPALREPGKCSLYWGATRMVKSREAREQGEDARVWSITLVIGPS